MSASEPTIRWTGVCIDCADAEELALFYSQLFDWPVSARDGEGWLQLRGPSGGVGLNIQSEAQYLPPIWPEEPGAQQKMIHFEVEVDDLQAAIDLAVRSGGRLADHKPADRDSSKIRIVLDPAGHPFCLFVSGE